MAATAACGTLSPAATIACADSESVNTTPMNPSCWRSRPVVAAGAEVVVVGTPDTLVAGGVSEREK